MIPTAAEIKTMKPALYKGDSVMSDKIVFHGKVLEPILRKKLNKPQTPITDQDISGITELVCENIIFSPDDIADLCMLTDLDYLDIETDTSDLSYLKSFSRLTDLNILCWDREAILDLQPLTALQKLESLGISGGLYSDIKLVNADALTCLKQLKDIEFHEFGSVDLSFLEKMPWMEYFYCVYGNRVENIESIGKLANLKELELTQLKVDNLDFLDTLPADTMVDLCALEVRRGIDMNRLNRFSSIDIDEIRNVNGGGT